MKTRILFAIAATLIACAGTSQARWGWGGRHCGPGWGGWGGPFFGIGFAAPAAVYRPVPVYYVRPAPVYVRTVTYRAVSPASELVRAQAQLASLGYYRGAVDGAFGPLTCRAIIQYQADYGLPLTGRLDRATLKSLGM